MKRSIPLFIISVLSLLFSGSATSQVAVGQWESHLPYSKAKHVAIVGNNIYCATDYSLFVYNKSTGLIEKIAKSDGLSDAEISCLSAYPERELLLIGYKNGNVDILERGVFTNYPDIKRKYMTGLKNINNACFNGNKAFLACAFGIVALDLDRHEISDTYLIGESGSQAYVYQTAINPTTNMLYAATENGLLKGDMNVLLTDFRNWEKVSGNDDFSQECRGVAYLGSTLYALFKQSTDKNLSAIYMLDANHNYQRYWENLNAAKALSVSYNHLSVIIWDNAFYINEKGEDTGNFRGKTNGTDYYITAGAVGPDGQKWAATKEHGLGYIDSHNTAKHLYPNGPADISASDIAIKNGIVWVAGGSEKNYEKHYGLYIYQEGKWYNINNKTNDQMDDTKAYIGITLDPYDPLRAYIQSWGYGFLDVKLGNEAGSIESIEIYNERNTNLETVVDHPHGYLRIGGLDFDSQGTMWNISAQITKPLKYRESELVFNNVEPGITTFNSLINVYGLLVDKYDNKWFYGANNGVFVYHEDYGKIKPLAFKDNEGNTQTAFAYSMEQDLDGTIWVGTDFGIYTYYNSNYVFNSDYQSSRIKLEEIDNDSTVQYLLGSESVRAIAVDGANRKWFGTQSSGVFLMSENGKDELAHFTAENSPLPDNQIQSIAVNDNTGEVFIATTKGMVSYKGTASEGELIYEENNVYAYPNPVKPDYSGRITIAGLLADSNVKVTTISGDLVFETTSLGGQAIWNGKNMNGERVSSGVYLVFATNDDGTQAFATKLLFLK